MRFLQFFVLFTLHAARAAIQAHEVTALPGFDGPLPSKHYSGYLPVGKTSGAPGMIHYWYIECETDPANAPIVYWTNGGPGGSGIAAGLLTEMGQVHLNEESFQGGNGGLKLLHTLVKVDRGISFDRGMEILNAKAAAM